MSLPKWSRASLFLLALGIIALVSSFGSPPAAVAQTTELPCYPGAYPMPIPPGYGDYCLPCYPGPFPTPIPSGYLGYCDPPCYPYYPGPFGQPPSPYVGYCPDACYTGQGKTPDGMEKCKKDDNPPEPCYYPGVEDPPEGYKKCKGVKDQTDQKDQKDQKDQ